MSQDSNSPRRLLLEQDGGQSVIEIVKDRVLVGRDPAADIILENHKVSRQHAILAQEGLDLAIEDLGSSNGTAVNGLPIFGPLRLSPGDVIEIGPYRLHVDRVSADGAPARPRPAVAPARVSSPAPAPAPATVVPAAPRPPARARAIARGPHPALVAILGIAVLAGAWFVVPSLFRGKSPTPGPAIASGVGSEETGSVPSSEAPPVSPPPKPDPVVAARALFGEVLKNQRFDEAASALAAAGSPADLASSLEAAMDSAAQDLEHRTEALRERQGTEAATAFLRTRLASFPGKGRHRDRLTAFIGKLPEDTGSGASTDDAPRPATVAAERGARPAPAPALDAETVKKLLESVATAEACLKDRNFTEAAQGFETAIGAVTAGGGTRKGRELEIQRRAERGLRAVARFRSLIEALVATLGPDPSVAGKVPHVSGHSGAVLGLDEEAVTVDNGGSALRLRWRVVPLATLKFLIRKAPLDPARSVDAAAVLKLTGAEKKEYEDCLARAFRKDPAVKPAIDSVLADALDMAEVPEKGFTLVDGEWLSPQQLARLELNREIKTRCQLLLSDKAEERQAAFTALLELGDTARNQLYSGLRQARLGILEKLAKSKGFGALADLGGQREEIDRRRRHAIELIYDEKRYPYPYRPPEASQEALAAYQESQPEVDIRVKAVNEMWKQAKSVPIPAEVRAGAARLREIDAWILRADAGEIPADHPWLMNLPAEDEMSLRTVATSHADRERIDGSARVMADNIASPGIASPGEQAQCRITNNYRMMMGRWAIRLYDPLVRASRGHCQDMERFGFFSHTSPVPGKETPMDRVRKEGMDPAGMSENIAISGGPDAAHRGWCHSPGHHRNLLSAEWRLMGPGNSGSKWCQNFSVADNAAGKDGTGSK